MDAPSEEANIRVHIDMLLDEEMREHAGADKTHDLHFQVFRVLGGYRQALDEVRRLRAEADEVYELAHKRPVPSSIVSMLCNMTERHRRQGGRL